MDNNSSEFIESIITGVTSNVVGAIDPKLDQLNRSQEVFQKNIEEIIERSLFDKLNNNTINIEGDVNESKINCGDSNYEINLYFKDFVKYKDNIDFQIKKQKAVDRIITPFLAIDMILKDLNNYKKTNEISYLNKAWRLWRTKFIPRIDSFSKKIEDIHAPEFNKIQKYLSSHYHIDITRQFISKKNFEESLPKIRYIRRSIMRLKFFLKILGGINERRRLK